MVTALQSNPLLIDDVIKKIIGLELPPILRRQHLSRNVTIGLVGDNGGGKSIGGGMISLLDYGLQGEPIFSNMSLKATLTVDDEAAQEYDLPHGGDAVFEALPIDKHKFLNFCPEYTGGVWFTHEFNIWMADARRSGSNLNLDADDVKQQMRKLQSAWIYDCVDEAFVDLRIRDATDIFIRTKDTALSPEGMARRQPEGIEFEWWLYAMTDKGAAILNAEIFNSKTNQNAVGPIYVKGKQFWGLIDTRKQEKRERYVRGGVSYDVEVGDTPELAAARDEWGWLQTALVELKKHYDRMEAFDLWQYLQLEERGLNPRGVGQILKRRFNIKKKQLSTGMYYYFDDFSLKKVNKPTTRTAELSTA